MIERVENDLLVTDKVGISFGGLVAVDEMSLRVPKGQVVSLIGPNGAGKTTLFNLITGFYKPDSGDILMNGESTLQLKPYEVISKGMARTFQNLRLFKKMTVLENVLIGHQHLIHYSPIDTVFNTKKKKQKEKEAIEYCCEILERVDLFDQKDNMCANLSYGQQKHLEIARAMASNPQLLLLDEPAAGLNPQETQELSNFIRKLLDYGLTVLLIEHDMSLVMRISDYIYVMNQGRMLSQGIPSYVQEDEKVIEAYIGRRSKQLVTGSKES